MTKGMVEVRRSGYGTWLVEAIGEAGKVYRIYETPNNAKAHTVADFTNHLRAYGDENLSAWLAQVRI